MIRNQLSGNGLRTMPIKLRDLKHLSDGIYNDYMKKQSKKNMRKRASKEPYEGYTLPPSAEKGGQFVDFNKIIKRKPLKKVRIKK